MGLLTTATIPLAPFYAVFVVSHLQFSADEARYGVRVDNALDSLPDQILISIYLIIVLKFCPVTTDCLFLEMITVMT